MNGYPRDMSDEMDEIFVHLFRRMQETAFSGNVPVSGYRIVVESTGIPGQDPERPVLSTRSMSGPVPEVHRIDGEVKVITELPGAAPESIRLELQGHRLTIDADGPEEPYHATAELPPVDKTSVHHSFRNGVLEVTFRSFPEYAAST
jgi:HSP20 family molecular chaperone IbpA